ncbi:MAG: PA14 domain-containing protein [Planctomycetota bacterium]|nr:PA14 domain-containing protein [Planctomycetota bacterium]
MESLESRRLFASGGGLLGTYHGNTDFTGATFARQDEQITFNFGGGEIAPGVGADTASIRWTGRVKPAYTETYTFKIISDDGSRLWVNGHLLFDTFDAQAGIKVNTGKVNLHANRFYDIRLEYREQTGPASIQMRWRSAAQYETLVPCTRLFPPDVLRGDALRATLDEVMTLAAAKYKATLEDLSGNTDAYPELTDPGSGRWRVKGADDWTSGFFPGVMWQLQRHTLDRSWRLNATAWTNGLASQVDAGDDLAFRFMPSYLNLYRAMSRRSDRLMVVAAAQSKVEQFDPTVGMFRSVHFDPSESGNPAANFPVLIDHTMDLELLYWAAKSSGNVQWIDLANSHLQKVIEHFIRPDGGTNQWGYFNGDTGAFVASQGRQGYADDTTWSRGQPWLLYSLANAYAETGRADFLAAAKKVADYWLAHVGVDMVPNWDFDAPASAGVFKDSSAAAVAASAFLKLGGAMASTPDGTRYRAAAEATLSSLASVNYLNTGDGRGLLKHGARWVAKGNVDDSLIYGDYYFLEAINRYNGLA